MKILVLSDSHSALSHMRRYIEAVKPDAVIHLGDHYDDGQAMAREYCHIPFYLLPGNCDRYRCPVGVQETQCYCVCGARLFMTHGHNHHVKATTYSLKADARKMGAVAALYGHTHHPEAYLEDGLWVLNPGSCGHAGGTAGILETDGQKITACYVIGQAALEGTV